MLDARITGELLMAARQSGAKVILAGDDRQLASIERGGLFTELKARHGSAEITEVTRQQVDWQRRAAQDLAEGRFGAAVAAYDQAGAITWTQDQDQARMALVAAWKRDTAAEPAAKRFVFAYTNRDVDALNVELRQVRRERGELSGPEVALETRHGPAVFAVGDRVQFTDTDKKAGIYNGNAGTITAIDERNGQLRAVLDAPADGKGRGSVVVGRRIRRLPPRLCRDDLQGPGQDPRPHLPLSQPSLARGGELCGADPAAPSAQVFVARETAARRTRAGLADGARRDQSRLDRLGHPRGAGRRQAKREPREHAGARATTASETVSGPRCATRCSGGKQASSGRRSSGSSAIAAGRSPAPDPLTAKVRAASESRQHQAELPAPEWLIPPYVSRDGQDSLGRGLDPAGIAAASPPMNGYSRPNPSRGVTLSAPTGIRTRPMPD